MKRFTSATLALLLLVSTGAMVTTGPAVAASAQTATVTVSVVEPDGDPVRDVKLTAEWDDGSTSQTTAANGKAFLDVPEDERVTVSIDHPNYVRNNPYVIEDAENDDVTITVYRKAEATITVTSAEGRVEGARIRLRKGGPGNRIGKTNADGVIETGVIEAGDYTVEVFKEGFYRRSIETRFTDDDVLNARLERGFVTLEVAVRDDHFDPPRPLQGAEVTVSGLGTIVTQSNGRLRIDAPVNSQFDIAVEMDGYRSVSQSVNVFEASKTVTIGTQREPGMSLELFNQQVVVGERASIEVTDEYGEPVENATITVNGNEVTRTGENGQALIRIGSSGEFEVHAEKRPRASATKVITGVTVDSSGGGSAASETESATATASTTDALGQPGFGPLAALVALVMLLALGRLTNRQ